MIPNLSEPQIKKLIQVLKSEEGIMQQIVEQGIHSIIEHGKKSDLKTVDAFVKSAGKHIRTVEEDVERGEDKNLDSLLDQMS